MKTIDFLPQKHREKNARHRAGLWRLLVVAMLGGVVTAASIGQVFHRRSVRLQLDELQPLYADAQAKQSQLAQLQTDLTRETAAATLYAYLQTPWPRTQVVAAMAAPVRENMRIEQFHVVEISAKATTAASESEAPPPALESMSPATRDLTVIRAEGAARFTQVEITGVCQNAAAIHEYLGQLEKSPLVARAELVSLENVTVEGQPRQLRFTAQVKFHAARGWSTSSPAAVGPAPSTLTQTTGHTP